MGAIDQYINAGQPGRSGQGALGSISHRPMAADGDHQQRSLYRPDLYQKEHSSETFQKEGNIN